MNEAQWLASADALAMLAQAPVSVTGNLRRLRLFSVDCCRQLSRWIRNPRLWKCLDACERYADRRLGESGMDKWTLEANRAWTALPQSAKGDADATAVRAAHHAIAYTCCGDRYAAWRDAPKIILHSGSAFGESFAEEMSVLFPQLLRDISGNPFRRFDLEPAWRTETVLGLAAAAYDGRAFDRMPILADALEDAGCANDDLLAHCRSPGPHARGCWAIDLILEKN